MRNRHELYRFFDSQETLLYVGITGSVRLRTNQHRRTQPWWDLVATMTVERFPSRAESEMAERVAIRDEDPVFNSARYHPDSLTRTGLRPVVNDCWVCGQPVVEGLDDEYDEEVLSRDHAACSDTIIDVFRRGVDHGRAGGR